MKENTYRREKEIVVTTVSMVLILGLYSLYVYQKYIAGNPELLNDFKFWGKTFLILIPVMIVTQIIIHIIFAIINKAVTDEDIPTLNDEMDKLIELKAMRISYWTNSFGFLVAMGLLAFGIQPWIMFIVLICSCFAGGVASGIAKIIYYRRGL